MEPPITFSGKNTILRGTRTPLPVGPCVTVDIWHLIEMRVLTPLDLIGNEECRENFLFVSRRAAIAEVREKFRGNGLVEAALITENGRQNEKRLGLISRWDMAGE